MKKDIILIGDGGHAKIVLDILLENDCYNIIGVTTNNVENKSFCGYPVLGNDDVLQEFYKNGVKYVALGIGGFKNNILRTILFEKLIKIGFSIETVMHPKSIISKSAKIGEGCVIFAGTVINAEVEIGKNVIIATGATIDHETVIQDNVLISAGVTIGANVKIGNGVLCALGSKVISGVTINKNILVAAGAVVVNNLIEEGAYFGCPAKKAK